MAMRRKDRGSRPGNPFRAESVRSSQKRRELSAGPNPLATRAVDLRRLASPFKNTTRQARADAIRASYVAPANVDPVRTSIVRQSRTPPKKLGLIPSNKNSVAPSTQAAHRTTWREPKLQTALSPASRSDDRKRENTVCKKRPRSTKGSGGSKRWVPWCG